MNKETKLKTLKNAPSWTAVGILVGLAVLAVLAVLIYLLTYHPKPIP